MLRADRGLGAARIGRRDAGAFGLLLVMAFAVTWAGVWIGLMVRDPDGADGIAMTVIFPMMFLSGIFVPVAGLPDGLRQIAEFNPLTSLATAMRQLFGSPTGPLPDVWLLQHPVLSSPRLGGGADGDLRPAVGAPLQADGPVGSCRMAGGWRVGLVASVDGRPRGARAGDGA